MEEELLQALKDFVATSNSNKYNSEKELLSKFPELQQYDSSLLKDFVATSNSGKYKSEEELISKFPEFQTSKKKEVSSSTSPSQELDLEQESQTAPKQDGLSDIAEPEQQTPASQPATVSLSEEQIKQDVISINNDEKKQNIKRAPKGIIRNTEVKLDGYDSPSTVLMGSHGNYRPKDANGKYVAFPTLFPKDPKNQTSNPNDWIVAKNEDEAYELAKQRNEVLYFDTAEEANKTAEGSWKSDYELSPKQEQAATQQKPEIAIGDKKEDAPVQDRPRETSEPTLLPMQEQEQESKPPQKPDDRYSIFSITQPELFNKKERLEKQISESFMSDTSEKEAELENVYGQLDEMLEPSKSQYRLDKEKFQELNNKEDQLVQKAEMIAGQNAGMNPMDILTTDGTYQQIQKDKSILRPFIEDEERIIDNLKKDTGGTQGIGQFFQTIKTAFTAEETPSEIVELDNRTTDEVMKLVEKLPEREQDQIRRGFAPLERKEQLITQAKINAIGNYSNEFKNKIEDLKKSDDSRKEKEKTFDKLIDERNTFFGAVGFDYAGNALNQTFEKTGKAREFNEMVGADSTFSKVVDPVLSFVNGLTQTALKATVGFTADNLASFGDLFTDQDEYSSFDAFSDVVGRATGFDYLPVSEDKRGNIIDDNGNFNVTPYSVFKTLGEQGAFTAYLMMEAKKGNISGLEKTAGRLLNPAKSKKVSDELKLVDSAYRATYSDNLAEAERMGLNGIKANAYALPTSLAEGAFNLFMPDTKYLKSEQGKAILAKFAGSLKSAANKKAVSNATFNLFKQIGLENLEEQSIAGFNDLAKMSLIVGQENSEYTDIKERKEIVAGATILSGALGVLGLRGRIKANKSSIYKDISKNVDELTTYFNAEIEKDIYNDEQKETLVNARDFAINVSESVKVSPKGVTGEQINLLAQKKKLTKEMESLDSAFKEEYEKKIKDLDFQIRQASQKSNDFLDLIPEDQLADLKEQARKELVAEKQEQGVNEFQITDEEISNRAVQLFENKTTTPTEPAQPTEQTPASSVQPNVQAFADEVSETQEDLSDVSQGALQVTVGDSNIILNEKDGNIVIESVNTPEGSRGKGSARKAIQKAVDVANGQGKTLQLDVKPLDDTTTTEGLTRLYESLGFKADPEVEGRMIKEPDIESGQQLKEELENESEKIETDSGYKISQTENERVIETPSGAKLIQGVDTNGDTFYEFEGEMNDLREFGFDPETFEVNETILSDRLEEIKNQVSNNNNQSEQATDDVNNPLNDVDSTTEALKTIDKEAPSIKKFFDTVYHATKGVFKTFDSKFLGTNTGATSAKEGFFFATNKNVAISYASKANDEFDRLLKDKEDAEKLVEEAIGTTLQEYNSAINRKYRVNIGETEAEINKNTKIINDANEKLNKFNDYKLNFDFEPVFTENSLSDDGQLKEVVLKMNDPFIFDYKGEPYSDKSFTSVIKEAKEKGHDGVILKNTFDGNNPFARSIETDINIVFNENQIQDSNQAISEAYHKAKADGSNPELVEAVEKLINNKQVNNNSKTKDDDVQKQEDQQDEAEKSNQEKKQDEEKEEVKIKLGKSKNAIEFTLKKNSSGLVEVFRPDGSVEKNQKNKVLLEYAKRQDLTLGKKSTEEGNQVQEQADALNDVAENSENPAEIAENIATLNLDQLIENSISYIDQIIANGITTVSRNSFLRFGDGANIGQSIGKSYLRNKGSVGIDGLAQELSETAGVEITPNDIIEFMMAYPNGPLEVRSQVKREFVTPLTNKFQELTGLPANPNIIQEAVNQAKQKELQEGNMSALDMMTDEELNTYYNEKQQAEAESIRERDNETQDSERSEQEPGVQGESNDSNQGQAEVDPSDDELLGFLNAADKKLKDFGNDNLGIGLPVVIARGVVKIIKEAYKAGKSATIATKEALAYIKSTKWYNSLSAKQKKEVTSETVKQAVVQEKNMTEEEAFDYIEDSTAKQDEDFNSKPPLKKQKQNAVRNLITKLSDRQFVSKFLIDKAGAQSTFDAMINAHGASGKAQRIYKKAYDAIYTDKISFRENGKLKFRFQPLGTKDRAYLDKVIMLKRFIAIDKNRKEKGLDPVTHPDYITGEMSQKYLNHLKEKIGQKRFNNLEERSKTYFGVFSQLLKEMQENGLISEKVFEELNGLDYQPRLFIQHVTDFEGSVSLGTAAREKSDTGGLGSNQIKELDGGSSGSLIRKSEWLLATSIAAREKSMAMNTINKTFMTKDLPEAKKRFQKLKKDLKNRKTWPTEDIRFYEYFKELNSKVVDNPILKKKKNENDEVIDGIVPEFIYERKYKGTEKELKNFKKAYYYKNGARQEFFLEEKLHSSWYDNITGFLNPQVKEVLGIASGSFLLKAVATGVNASFALVNTPRDFMFNVVFSDQYSSVVLKGMFQVTSDVFKSLNTIRKSQGNITKDGDLLEKYIYYGGDMAFLSTQGLLKKQSIVGQGIENFFESRNAIRFKRVAKGVFDTITLQKVNEYSEIMFRMGLFQRTVKNELKKLGLTDISQVKDLKDKETGEVIETQQDRIDAIYSRGVAEARSLLDFNQGGVYTKDAEAVIPYINTAVQGTRVAIDATRKEPAKVISKILQSGAGLSAATIAISLASIRANKDDDDERNSVEIWLDAKQAVSQYQSIQYSVIFTGTRDEDGNYNYVRIAKNQQLAPVLNLFDNIYEEALTNIYTSRKRKNVDVIYNEAWTAIQNNIIPIEVYPSLNSISQNLTKNPAAKAVLTYTTGYDFYRDQPLTFDNNQDNPVMAGAKDGNIEDFYKEFGREFRLAPANLKGTVESLITTPDTNYLVGILYAGLDASVQEDKGLEELAKAASIDIGNALKGRAVGKTSDFNRQVNAERVFKDELEEIKTVNDYRSLDIDNATKDFFENKLSVKEYLKKLDELDALTDKDAKTVERKLKGLLERKNVDRYVVGLYFESDKEVRALKIAQYYGDIFSQENRDVLNQMDKLGLFDVETMKAYYKMRDRINAR